MPNLTLRTDRDLMDVLKPRLDAVAALLRERLGAGHPNVMLVSMERASGTADVYAEFLYLEGEGRDVEDIGALAEAIGATLGISDRRMAFRGFPVAKGQIVSRDVPLHARAC